jgi:hypothetical protein
MRSSACCMVCVSCMLLTSANTSVNVPPLSIENEKSRMLANPVDEEPTRSWRGARRDRQRGGEELEGERQESSCVRRTVNVYGAVSSQQPKTG